MWKHRTMLSLGSLAVAWLSAAAPVQAAAPPVSPIVEHLDLRYGNESDLQKLDVFAPRGAKRTPVVFFVHGGTWMFGDKNFYGHYRAVGRYLANNGVTAVMVNYRLSPTVKHPDHVRDVARALSWTYHNIARYGGDPGCIVVAGHSAGGHLATLVVSDPKYLRDPALHLPANVTEKLAGVVAFSGVYRVPGPAEFNDMLKPIVRSWVGTSTMTPVLMEVGLIANPFRLVFGDDSDVRHEASPLSHIHAGLPPFLLLYAGCEVPGLASQAKEFADLLRKAGDRVDLEEIPEATHNTILFRVVQPGNPAGKLLLDFVGRVADRSRS
jgi:acetyl esterase/lipase